jgi:hypothetical protein
MEVEIFSVGLQVSHLQFSFVQDEIAYDEAILSQYSEYFLRDCPIHTRSSDILYNETAFRVEQLWLSNLHEYSNYIYYIVCN